MWYFACSAWGFRLNVFSIFFFIQASHSSQDYILASPYVQDEL